MTLYLPPASTSYPVSTNKNLEYFALKYGFHGTIMCLRDRSKALTEVKQLDFSTCMHRTGPEQRWDMPKIPRQDVDEVEESWHPHYIPNKEIQQYSKALFSDFSVLRAYNEGARYNEPVGLKRWVEEYEPEYQELTKLKVLDYY